MSAPRRWARRAMLSALAGSGLTAAGFGGPFAGGALGAEAPAASTATTESPSASVTETSPQAPAPAQGASGADGTSTTTSTTAPSTTPAPSSTSTTPSAPTPAAGAPQATETPTVVVQRSQQTTHGKRSGTSAGSGSGGVGAAGQAGSGAKARGEGAANSGPSTPPAGAPNGVAPAPLVAGGELNPLPATLFAGSAVSAQALDFYRIPLFLLPVYQAAAFQYDLPWQVLAAINEVETDYGTDLSVSTAGAVGWMQFMPTTWLQYGVDATDAGYADPYNPVDAIFAAARYLHAAGASRNLRGAIFSYNHSQEYVESVLLRARLIASYPRAVIATLTGLVDGRAPTAGARVAPGTSTSLGTPAPTGAAAGSALSANPPTPSPGSSSPAGGSANATAGAVPAPAAPALVAAAPAPAAAAAAGTGPSASARTAAMPKPAPPPQVAAARAEAAANAPAKAPQLTEILGAPGAAVVAVEDGRIVHLGHSHGLGRYLVLRDIYGDVFTYAGLGSIAPRYRPAQGITKRGLPKVAGAGIEPVRDPAPRLPASAGHQSPLTLKVRAHAAQAPAPVGTPVETEGEAPAGMGRVRLFAHPDNPVARSAAARAARSTSAGGGGWQALRTGSIVSEGTVLGHLDTPTGANAGRLRFAIRPAGDSGTIDPQPLLANWRQLDVALHPKGSKGAGTLLGATAEDALLMSKSELERTVLSDPGIQLDACGRRDVAAGAVDRRLLGVLEFLSRSGLQPTVTALRCRAASDSRGGLSIAAGAGAASTLHAAALEAAAHGSGTAMDISAINGIPIAGHQGPGTVTDVAIRTLLTLRGRFAPHRIVSLMRYPEAPATEALPTAWDHIHIDFLPQRAATTARAATAGSGAASPLAVTGDLNEAQWSQLIGRIAALPKPPLSTTPSSSAIRDPQAALTNRGLGARGLTAGT